jgi:nucleoside-diphosphate-sugar epimerase
MKALVTGGGGFLGRYIVELLIERGDSVTVFARGAYPELEAQGATVVRADIQDAAAIGQACRGVDVVFHAAGRLGTWGSWDAFYGPNVVGTENVIAACQANGVGRLIYTGSPSGLFDGSPQEGVDESRPYPKRYTSYYGHTKALAEQRVIAANGQAGVLTTSLRPHFIWGPRDRYILPRLIDRARKRVLVQMGPPTTKKDLTFVEDAARAHVLAADALSPGSPAAGSAYFVSQDEPVPFWPWLKELLGKLGLPPIRLSMPLSVAQALGSLMEAVYRALPLKGEPMLTRFIAEQLGQSQYYDISRAKRDLGYRPRYTMTEAQRKTVAYLKEHGIDS